MGTHEQLSSGIAAEDSIRDAPTSNPLRRLAAPPGPPHVLRSTRRVRAIETILRLDPTALQPVLRLTLETAFAFGLTPFAGGRYAKGHSDPVFRHQPVTKK